MIEEYHFGSIVIDGKAYDYDVEARCPGQVLKWWRKESHIIDIEDIKNALEQKPGVIIIGTGQSGVAQVTGQAQAEIKSKGIKLIIEKTGQAIKTFNRLCQDRMEKQAPSNNLIGLFHLTC